MKFSGWIWKAPQPMNTSNGMTFSTRTMSMTLELNATLRRLMTSSSATNAAIRTDSRPLSVGNVVTADVAKITTSAAFEETRDR